MSEILVRKLTTCMYLKVAPSMYLPHVLAISLPYLLVRPDRKLRATLLATTVASGYRSSTAGTK